AFGPEPDGLMARRVALAIVFQILRQRRSLDEAFALDPYFPGLDLRDRGFVRMLVSTCLRRKGQIDDLIRRAQDKPGDPDPALLGFILHMGICQLCFMNVPDHAAVDTSVQLADENGLSKQKGFVNALLRRVADEGASWLEKQAAVRMNMPGWILEAWVKDYGLSG